MFQISPMLQMPHYLTKYAYFTVYFFTFQIIYYHNKQANVISFTPIKKHAHVCLRVFGGNSCIKCHEHLTVDLVGNKSWRADVIRREDVLTSLRRRAPKCIYHRWYVALRYQSNTFTTDNADSFVAVSIVDYFNARYNKLYCFDMYMS
jgi:hypothetical protein